MPILDAALAFSLTMLVVASVVTIVVSFVHSLLGARKKRVKQMITAFLDEELQPVAEREMKRLSAQLAEDGIQAITNQASVLSKAAHSEFFTKEHLDQLAKLTTEDLKEHLKRSDLGSELLTHLGDRAEPVFDQFAERYESVSNKFAQKFRNNSRIWSTIIAMILAVGLNIDSVFILDCFLKNHTARDAIIGQMDQILLKYDTEVQRAIASLNEEPDSFAAFGLAADEGGAAGEEGNAAEEFKAAYAQTKKTIDSLMGFGLPIGWEYFPYSERHHLFGGGADGTEHRDAEPQVEKDATASSSAETGQKFSDSQINEDEGAFSDQRSINSWADIATWSFGVILTGLLAGVGAPFWYDLVTGISRVRDRKKGTTAQASSP